MQSNLGSAGGSLPCTRPVLSLEQCLEDVAQPRGPHWDAAEGQESAQEALNLRGAGEVWHWPESDKADGAACDAESWLLLPVGQADAGRTTTCCCCC